MFSKRDAETVMPSGHQELWKAQSF